MANVANVSGNKERRILLPSDLLFETVLNLMTVQSFTGDLIPCPPAYRSLNLRLAEARTVFG